MVVVKDLERGYGAGLEVGLAVDAGKGIDGANAATQASAYKTLLPNGKYRYDVFSALVVGDDSFTITGFGGNNTSANYIAPKSDVHNDMHAQMAGIAANWSYGMLVYRPERICSLKFNVNKNPAIVSA